MTLADLKPGDEVLVCGQHWSFIQRVARVTKRDILVGPTRYSRRTGHPIGSYASVVSHRIRIPTDADREKMRKHDLIRQIKRFTQARLRQHSAEKLQHILTQLETASV